MKRQLLLTTSLLLSAGCMSAPKETRPPQNDLEAYCIASEPGVVEHARNLSRTSDVDVAISGDLVIRQRDAVCDKPKQSPL